MGAAITASLITGVQCAGTWECAELGEDSLQTGAEFEETEAHSDGLHQLEAPESYRGE